MHRLHGRVELHDGVGVVTIIPPVASMRGGEGEGEGWEGRGVRRGEGSEGSEGGGGDGMGFRPSYGIALAYLNSVGGVGWCGDYRRRWRGHA